MKRSLTLTLLFIFLTFGSIASAENQEISGVQLGNAYLPAGTNIAVELIDPVNSKRTFVGEVLEVNILEDIVLNNTVVIEKGSNGYVMVSNVRQAKDWGKAGGVELQPQYVKTANWIKVPLLQGIKKNGDGHDVIRPFGLGAAGAAGETALGIAGKIAGLFLFYVDPRPGHEVEIPAGTKFIVTTGENIDLQVSPDKLQEAMTLEAARRGSASIANKQNWTGTYNTNRGQMTLVQNGSTVTGTYERGNGTIDGRISGNILTGKWIEEKSKVAPSGKGYFEFTMSSIGNSTLILWRHDYSKNWIEDRWSAKLNGF